MTEEERKLALYCLKASSSYHSEVCEECIKYPNCDHTIQDDVTETIIKALEQLQLKIDVLDKIRDEMADLAARTMNDNRASGIWTCVDILDKYKRKSEVNNDKR